MNLKQVISNAQNYLDPAMVDCVVYHHPCNDGSGAALSAWTKHQEKIIYCPRMYHQDFDDQILRDHTVIVLDASFKKEHLNYLRTICKKIMILDHHYSAMQELANEEGCFFTMESSGAILSWHYFNGLEKNAPKLLQLIEDRDLWQWKERALSEPLYYAIRDLNLTENFRMLAPYLEQSKLEQLIEHGKTLVARNQSWCKQAALNIELRNFKMPKDLKTYKIACGEIGNATLVSELAEYL